MILKLKFPPDIEAQLNKRAAERGQDAQTFALEALQEALAADTTAAMLPKVAWYAKLDALLASLPQTEATFVDDNRESIYSGRGE